MSLFLQDQKLGSHSGAESSSHKFMLKGRQTGGMHRGHSWVFRAESYDTMMAWFDDIKNLTEKTGAERNAFVRQHARSVSAGSQKPGSISSEGMDEDEADAIPYSATTSQVGPETVQQEKRAERPNPGGRFPSALNINRDSQVPLPPSSPSSSGERDVVAAARLPRSGVPFGASGQQVQTGDDEARKMGEVAGAAGQPTDYYVNSPVQKTQNRSPSREAARAPMQGHEPQGHEHIFVTDRQEYNSLPGQKGPEPMTFPVTQHGNTPVQSHGVSSDEPGNVAYAAAPSDRPLSQTKKQLHSQAQPQQQPPAAVPRSLPHSVERHDSQYGDWMAPAAAGLGGTAIGAAGVEAYRNNQRKGGDLERDIRSQPQRDKVEPAIFPSTTSTHPLPANAAWAVEPTVAPVLPAIGDSPEDPFGSRRPSETPQRVPENAAWANQSYAAPVLASVGTYNDEPIEARVPDTVAEETQTPGGTLSDPLGHLSDPAAPIRTLASRPRVESQASTTTISALHIPGEYPKSSTV